MWLEDALLSVLSASIDQLLEFPACVLMWALLAGGQRGEPRGLVDVGMALAMMLLLGLLVRPVLRSPVRSLAGWGRTFRLPEGTEGPTAGWAHFVWSGVWVFLGVTSWDWPVFGPGFVIVGGGLAVFRASVRLKRALE
jgi:hypothetical protein